MATSHRLQNNPPKGNRLKRKPSMIEGLSIGGLALAACIALPQAAGAAALGLATAQPYGQAVAFTEQAARAVLARSGKESCLRGKLTRALLGLSASCEAGGVNNALCNLAERAVVVPVWSLPFMDTTARELLEQIAKS